MSDEISMSFDAVYHGSPVRIGCFNREHASAGFFFADRPEVARDWANETARRGRGWLNTARVQLKDAVVIDAAGAHWSELPDPWDDGEREIDDIARDAECRGFDGLVVRNVQDSPDTMDGATNTTVVAFHPSQITILSRTNLTLAEPSGDTVDPVVAARLKHMGARLERLQVRMFRSRLPEAYLTAPEWVVEKCPQGGENIRARLMHLLVAHPRVTTGWTPTSIRGFREHWIAYRTAGERAAMAG